MTEAEEIELIEADIAELGARIEQKRARVLEILQGRTAVVRGKKFTITGTRIYPGRTRYRVFYTGPVLKKDGTPRLRETESAPLHMIESITK